jgi:hypothetical protein
VTNNTGFCLRLAPFLTGLRVSFFCRDWPGSDLRIGHFFSFRRPLVNIPQLNTELLNCLLSSLTAELRLPRSESESESYVKIDGQSASLSWNKAPIWDLRQDFYYCQTVAGLLMWGALSDERTALSFAIATIPRQRSYSRVRGLCFRVRVRVRVRVTLRPAAYRQSVRLGARPLEIHDQFFPTELLR